MPADLDNMNPGMGAEPTGHVGGLPPGEHDHEGAMARADLFKLANYSLKLFKQLDDNSQLEAWVQAKITKAADYVASVYHYLEYEMKFSEYGEHLSNAEVYNEDQKKAIQNKLMEAKEKLKALKLAQAEKLAEAKVIGGGKEEPCPHCGGAGHIVSPGRTLSADGEAKVEKYKRLIKATKAAHKRMDANGNGIPDHLEGSKKEAEVEEDMDSKAKEANEQPDDNFDEPKKEKKPSRGVEETFGQGIYEAKKSPKAKKDWDKDGKIESEKDEVIGSRRKAAGLDEAFDEKSKTGDTFKTRTGVATKTSTGVVHKNTSYADDGEAEEKSGKGTKSHAKSMSAAEKKDRAPALKKSKTGTWGMENGQKFDNRKTNESLKGKQKNLDVDSDGDIEADDLADLRAGKKKKESKVEEGKPSAGMSKKEKSATVKAAKAGKDIGKPGKNFDKVAKAAGGGEKGERIAAAAMWKNKAKSIKESLDQLASKDVDLEEAAEQNMDTLIKMAIAQDPKGFEAAAKNPDGNALAQYLQQFAQKAEQAAGVTQTMGTQAQPAATAPAQPAAPAQQPALAESADLNRMKQFLTRLNG